jgi:hypothetical protein
MKTTRTASLGRTNITTSQEVKIRSISLVAESMGAKLVVPKDTTKWSFFSLKGNSHTTQLYQASITQGSHDRLWSSNVQLAEFFDVNRSLNDSPSR